VPDPDTPGSGGEVMPLRLTIDEGEIRLEPARLEQLTLAQQAEAVALLAGHLAAALCRRGEGDTIWKAA
jgi:hypothetical protein